MKSYLTDDFSVFLKTKSKSNRAHVVIDIRNEYQKKRMSIKKTIAMGVKTEQRMFKNRENEIIKEEKRDTEKV